nr:reverse transcriptase domain-containing protein [Tanacetum cinerariifolium]
MRPPGFNQPNQQNSQNNQNRYQGNNFNPSHNQNRQNNQGVIYQNPPQQDLTYQAPIPQNSVSNDKFEAYTKANDANMNNLQLKFDIFQKSFEKKQDDFQNMMMNFIQNLNNNKASSFSSLPSNTIPNPRNEAKAITTRSGISYDGPSILPPVMEKEPEATKDPELPSTKNIQPPSVQVHEKDKEPVDKPFDVSKTKTNFPYPSRLRSINLNSQRLNKEKHEVKNVVEQPAERRTRIIESLQNFRVIHKSSISLKNTSQISPVHAVAPILSTKEPEYSPSMRYEHPNTTSEMESDEIKKSGVEELVQILRENEVTSEDKRECDMLFCENSPICDDHYEIFFDSKNDNDEQSLTHKCGDTPSISYNNFESLNKVDLIDATCEEYSQNVLGFSDIVASDNPTPNNNSIISNSSPTLTPFGESDFFSEEIENFLNNDSIPIEIENYVFDMEGDILLIEKLLNEDPCHIPPMDIKVVEESKEKSSFEEPPEVELKDFSNELAHINPEITEADYDFKEEIRLIKNLLYDNSSPRPTEELNAEIANTIVESIPSSLIPVQDNKYQREEIDIVTNTDELLPLGFENDDSEGEIDIVEELHVDNSISNSENELSDIC